MSVPALLLLLLAAVIMLLLLLLRPQQQCVHQSQLLGQVSRHSHSLKVPPAPSDLNLWGTSAQHSTAQWVSTMRWVSTAHHST